MIRFLEERLCDFAMWALRRGWPPRKVWHWLEGGLLEREIKRLERERRSL